MKRVIILTLLLGLFYFNPITFGNSGCCSWHDGVCGDFCCDGTMLSDACSDSSLYCTEEGIGLLITKKNKERAAKGLLSAMQAGGAGAYYIEKLRLDVENACSLISNAVIASQIDQELSNLSQEQNNYLVSLKIKKLGELAGEAFNNQEYQLALYYYEEEGKLLMELGEHSAYESNVKQQNNIKKLIELNQKAERYSEVFELISLSFKEKRYNDTLLYSKELSKMYLEDNDIDGYNKNEESIKELLVIIKDYEQQKSSCGVNAEKVNGKCECKKGYEFINGQCELLKIAVSQTDELSLAVEWMYKNGLTKYSSVKDFQANEYLTREQASKFFVQFGTQIFGKKINNSASNKNFKDINDADYTLQSYIIDSEKLGLFQGTNGFFKPYDNLTIAQAIAVIIRMKDGFLDESGEDRYFEYHFRSTIEYDLLKDLGFYYVTLDSVNIKRGEVAILLYRLSQL